MAPFMLHALLTPLSQFACDIKSWRHKLKKHLLAAIPPSMELAWVLTGPQSSRTLKRPLRTGISCSALMMSLYVFFSLVHHLMEPLAVLLWCTGASCYCGHDQLHLWAKRIVSCTLDATLR